MAQSLDEQILTIERALGERMVDHALVVVRGWLEELGENNPYEEACLAIGQEYQSVFDEWLTGDNPEREATLDRLTMETYRLVDAVYVALRLHRGLSPEMHGFNADSPQSVMHYFANCVQFSEDDWKWFASTINDEDKAAMGLMAVGALAKNIRECFNEQALYALIDGMNGANDVVAEQCLANLIILLAHYDVRIDFFSDIQNAFMAAIDEMDDDGEQAFQTLCALVRSVKSNWREQIASGELKVEDLPEELRNLLELTGDKDNIEGVMGWVPKSEQDYMQGLIQMLPDTWVFSAIVGDSQERAQQIAIMYLSVGRMDLLWDRIDIASSWLLKHLRKGSQSPMDYMNYGHCLLLQGDRMMAYEYYRQARQLCKGPREFFAIFRPDRHDLVEHGVPMEHVYMLEDKLLRV